MTRLAAFLTCCVLALTALSPNARAADVYFVAVGSGFYAAASADAHGFAEFNGANHSARMVADRLARGGARFGILLTSTNGTLVGVADIMAAIKAVETRARSDRAVSPLLVFYFTGHGITEGVAWNHFSVPGNFTYRGPPESLPVEGLAAATLHAASLADALDKTSMPYLVLLDTCYEGTAARFESPVLTGPAIESLRQVGTVLRTMNEFHQSSPVLFSTAPGTVVPTVADPSDPGANRIGPLARRAMIILDSAAAAGRSITLGDFVTRMRAGDLDPATHPAVTYATSGPAWRYALAAVPATPGPVEPRSGTATVSAPCCAAELGPPSYSAYGHITVAGSAGEFVTGGRTIAINAPPTPMTIAQDGPGDLTITVGDPPGDWEISLATPDKAPFQLRRYAGAQRYPFAAPDRPALSVSGDSRGCNDVLGEFQIDNVQYDGNGRLMRMAASLRQFCDGAKVALTAAINLRAVP